MTACSQPGTFNLMTTMTAKAKPMMVATARYN